MNNLYKIYSKSTRNNKNKFWKRKCKFFKKNIKTYSKYISKNKIKGKNKNNIANKIKRNLKSL